MPERLPRTTKLVRPPRHLRPRRRLNRRLRKNAPIPLVDAEMPLRLRSPLSHRDRTRDHRGPSHAPDSGATRLPRVVTAHAREKRARLEGLLPRGPVAVERLGEVAERQPGRLGQRRGETSSGDGPSSLARQCACRCASTRSSRALASTNLSSFCRRSGRGHAGRSPPREAAADVDAVRRRLRGRLGARRHAATPGARATAGARRRW